MQSVTPEILKPETEPLSLADMWNVLIRNKKMIAMIVCAFVSLGLIYCVMTPKIYKAEAVILIESQEKNVEIKSVLAEIPNEPTLVPSEMQVLVSRNLMEKVLDKLQLGTSEEKMSAAEAKNFKDAKIDEALKDLVVKQIDKSRAISVSYTSKDAKLAADIVNTLTQLYIEQQISNNFEAVRLTNSWLSDRVIELQNKVSESEQKVEDYRASKGLVESPDGGLTAQDIMGLSKKLNDAKAQLAEAESKLPEVSDPALLESAPTVLSSILIQKLRESETATRSELASLSNSLGNNHPQIKELNAKLSSIQFKIRLETNKIAEGVKREHQSSLDNVASIERQMAALKGAYAMDKSETVTLAALQREAETNRKFLETINLRWKETEAQADARLQVPYARVISTAGVPMTPESPRKKLILLSALLAGLGLGAGLALVKDQMQNTVYNGKQIQSLTGLTNISMVADARRTEHGAIPNFADIPLSDQSSEYMEGIRELSAFLKLQKSRAPSEKIFCFSSSTRGEGKSSLVASLARQLALEGVKVLAVDCDIRQQTLSNMFEVNEHAGLTEVMAGRLMLRDVIIADKKSPLSLIAIGQAKGNVNLFLRSPDAWQKMMNEASQGFDVVLLDNSPSLSTPEAKIIAGIGKNIFCIRWKKTPLKVIGFALDALRRSESHVVGTIVTMSAQKDNVIYIADKNAA